MVRLTRRIVDKDGNTYVYETEATAEDIKDMILKELEENYYLEFTFTLPTGQVVKVQAKLKKAG